MQSNDLFSEVRRVLSASESITVLAALRQDPLVWQALEQSEFLASVMEHSGNRTVNWSPGALSLLALGDPRPADVLRAEPLPALGQALQERTLQAYQSIQRKGKASDTIGEAGLLALALRERRRLTGTWSGFLQEILPKPAASDVGGTAAVFAVWRTPLACLYGLVSDPEDMLRGLLPRTVSRIPFLWIIHTQLAQPVDEATHIEVFSRLLQGLPVTFQLYLLRCLSLSGAEGIASALAGSLVVGHPGFASLRTQTSPKELDLPGLSSRALALQQMGAFYQLSGDRTQALSLYNAAETALEQWRAGLYLQCLNLQVGQRAGGTGILIQNNQIAHVAAGANWLKNDLGAVVISHPYGNNLLEAVNAVDQGISESDSPFLQLQRARKLFEREPAVARDLAHQGAAGLLGEIRQHGLPFSGDFVYTWQPEDILTILLDLDLLDEALALSQALLEIRPADIRLVYYSGKILSRLGKFEQALQAALNLAAFEPENIVWRRQLADLWGLNSQWAQSYKEWQVVLGLHASPEPADLLACGQAAFQSGNIEQAVELSEAVLKVDANCGLAQGLMGQALVASGDATKAVQYLVRATLLSPETLTHWLSLAEVQQKLGEPQRALESLRAAVTALPEAAEAHLALGRACVDTGLPAEALPHLRKACQLLPAAQQATLLYSHTLRTLGHASEARKTLETTRASWNTCPELAYEYAQTLLDLNDAEAALPVMEAALRNGLSVLDGHLLYARILLGEYQSGEEGRDMEMMGARMQQASQALRHILDVEPENLEARFLMADILREKGDLDEALAAYRSLADTPSAAAPELRWRVQWGLGRTALCLGQIDTALAALKEACQARPDSLKLQRMLAEASLQANLPQEGLEAAAYALQFASDDIDTLAWFADFVTRAGEPRRAVDALQRAVQLDPGRADLFVSLAVGQLSSGDLSGAHASLQAVMALETVTRSDLRRAAHVYLRLEDLQSSLACFQRALSVEPPAPADLFYEVAQLQERMGSHEAALELAQHALDDPNAGLPIHLLQADLLVRLNRQQAALAVLERALRIAQSGQEAETGAHEQKSILAGIHERFMNLMLKAGDFPTALHHAECALLRRPEDAALCRQAADLALSQLQFDRAARIVDTFWRALQPDAAKFPSVLFPYGQEGMDLICLQVEMALDNAREADIAAWIEEALSDSPEEPRLLAARARMLARQNDLPAACQSFEAACKRAGTGSTLWLAEAALEVQRWKEARAAAEGYARVHANEARAQLVLARILVLSAEQQRLCEAAGSRRNAPGVDSLNEGTHRSFEEAIQAAVKLVNIGEVGRWQARGQAVFAPSTQSARALAAMPANPEDTAALVAVLRQLNNRAAAVQVARRHAEHPAVQIQLALCYPGESAAEGIAAAGRAVSMNPNQPLAHAILALLSRQSGESLEALQEYENALLLWADEPDWQDAAGDLCGQVGNIQAAIFHRKQALALDPGNPRFAFKLGQACLADEDISSAVSYLERSTMLNPDQADVWLTLATAYHMSDRLPQALEAAKKAGELNPSSAEGLLIAGETALSMNQTDEAFEFAQGAARREPENAGAVLFLSNVLVLRGRLEDGLDVLEQAAPSVKAVFPVAFERAKLTCRLHGPQAALEALEKLAKDHPEEPELLGYLARIQAESGELKSAERYAFKALRLDPNQPDLTFMLGRLQHKMGQLDQAVHLLGEAIHMAPETLDAYLELGAVYQERREFTLALQVYREAIRIAPGDYQAFYQSGLLMRDSKDYSGAETMLRRAAELAPDNLSIRRQLVGVIALNLVHHKQEVSA